MEKNRPSHPEHKLKPKNDKSPHTSSGRRLQGARQQPIMDKNRPPRPEQENKPRNDKVCHASSSRRLQGGKTTTSVPGPDASPRARPDCNFRLKEYETAFTCYVCMMDSYETKRYRCDHCDRARHECCIQLKKNIKINSSCPISHWKGKELELHDQPKIEAGKHKSTKNRVERCMVCRMPVERYSYQHLKNKTEKDIIMHPYCADLITQSKGSSSSTLKLEDGEKHNCFWCGKKYPCCLYLWKSNGRSDCYIHVYCYSKMRIQVLKGTAPLQHGNNRSASVVVKEKRSDGGAKLGWEALLDLASDVVDQALGLGGLTRFILWSLD